MPKWLKMPEWLIGGLFGVFCTLLGVFLQMYWDNVKFARETKQRDEAVLMAVKEEVQANLRIIKENRRLHEEDLAYISKDRILVKPLSLLYSDTWGLVKISRPQQMMRDANILLLTTGVWQRVFSINESIRSRENYRIHSNEGAYTFFPHLKHYNEMLLKEMQSLASQLEKLYSSF